MILNANHYGALTGADFCKNLFSNYLKTLQKYFRREWFVFSGIRCSILYANQPQVDGTLDRQEQLAHSTRTYKKRPEGRFLYVRVGRIELPSSAWKAEVLPLNYTRIVK